MRAALVVALGALGALAACGKGSGKSCEVEADELAKFLTTMDHDQTIADSSARPPIRTDLKVPATLEQAPVISADDIAISYQNKLYAADDLTTQLRTDHAKILDDIATGKVPKRYVPHPDLIYFVFDAGTPWKKVVGATNAARDAGFVEARLMFARQSKTEFPPQTAIDADFDKLIAEGKHDGGNIATGMAKLVSGVIERCGALKKVFGAVGADEGGDKAAMLLAAVGPALKECSCAVDIPTLRTALWRVTGNPKPMVPLAVKLDPAATPITFPSDTPWSEASKQLTASTTSVAFGVR